MPAPPLIALLGATATGKTAVAMQLAAELGLEIVNVDSRQVYREMDIGTAKPPAADRARVPHHLFDLASPADPFSAGDYVRAAGACLAGLWRVGRRPLLVGGTGFYFEALVHGLPALEATPETRAGLENRWRRDGLGPLVDDLRRLDPQGAERVEVANPRRVIRALEILLATGKPLATALTRTGALEADVLTILVGLPRPALWDRIQARTREMMAAGLPQEATRLLDTYGPAAPGLQTIGYAEWVGHRGEPVESVAGQIAVHTRQYAKRQETWFRKRPGGVVHRLDLPGAYDRIRAAAAEFLAR